MAVFGYLVYCVITLWVVAGAFVLSVFSSSVQGKIEWECWIANGVAAAFLYGAYAFFPFTVTVG